MNMTFFRIMLLLLLINSMKMESATEDSVQAYFFINSTNCPECRIPKIYELNNNLKYLLPNVVTNLVFINQTEPDCSEQGKRFKPFDFFFCGEEADILSKYYDAPKNEAKLVIAFRDSIKKDVHIYNLFDLNQFKLSSIIKKHYKSENITISNIEMNNHVISTLIFTDKSNRDTTIIIDITKNDIYLFDNISSKLYQKIVLPDSAFKDFLSEINDPIIRNELVNPYKSYNIINILEFNSKEIIFFANILTEVGLDTTYEYYEEKQEQVFTLLPVYTYKLIRYDIASKNISFDTIPHDLLEKENLYQLFRNENKYFCSHYVLKDTAINRASSKFPIMSCIIPYDNKARNLYFQDILHLLQNRKIYKSIFNLMFNHFDSSFVIFNLRNNLFFIYKPNGEIVNINPAGALKYIFSPRDFKNHVYLLTNNKFEHSDLINITADDKFIYVAVRYTENELDRFKIILQKYNLNGQMFSEEVLNLNIENINNFQFISVRNDSINALIHTDKTAWQMMRINN